MVAKFRKPGRPAEDRAGRRDEIYRRVSPLIRQRGFVGLSMAAAARAASRSPSGLYLYFQSKRDLALFGVQPATLSYRCAEFHRRWGALALIDPASYLQRHLEFICSTVVYVQPSMLAAMQLGTDAFSAGIDAALSAGLDEFTNVLRRIHLLNEPSAEALGRALRRACIAALVDCRVTEAEILADLKALLVGYAQPGGPMGC